MSNTTPQTFYLAGSNDGMNWALIDNESLASLPTPSTSTVSYPASYNTNQSYLYFRLIIPNNFGGATVQLFDWQMYGHVSIKIVDSAGVTGEYGFTGLMAALGFTGWVGETGITGILGRTGPTGFTGRTGITGPTGLFTGRTGITGATGTLGYRGQTGPWTGSTGSMGPIRVNISNVAGSFPLNTDPALVLYYPFNTDVLNYATGVGVSGATIIGSTAAINNTVYKIGSGSFYQIDTYFTADSYLLLPTIPVNTGGYSFSFWVYITTSNPGMVWSFNNSSNNGSNRIFIYYNNSGNLCIGSDSTYPTFYTPSLNQWYHIVWTINTSNNSIVYVNGSSVYTTTSVSYVNYTFNKNYILADPYDTGYQGIKGYIDDFRYYNRILNSSEVTSLYNYNGTNTLSSYNILDTTGQTGASGITGYTGYTGFTGVWGNTGIWTGSTGPTGPVRIGALGSSITPGSFPLNNDSTLLVYYPFDNNELDYATGSGVSDASLISGASINKSNYKVGSGSVSFSSSSNQYLNLNSNSVVNTSGFVGTNGLTFACWFQSNSNVTWARIFDWGNGGPSDNIILYINNNNIGVSVYKGANPTQYNNITSTNYNTNIWYHIVWTITYSGTYTVYINGSQIWTSTGNNYPNAVARSSNYIGKSNWSDPYWNGNIDDFRCYQRVLNQSEITSLYNYNGLTSSITTYNLLDTTGHSGFSGFSGRTGYTGFYGITGVTSVTGVTGIIGGTGWLGTSGISGVTGVTGVTGYGSNYGITGYTGIIGDTGVTGFTGRTGRAGLSGWTGFLGKTGIQGVTGVSGVTGQANYGSLVILTNTDSGNIQAMPVVGTAFTSNSLTVQNPYGGMIYYNGTYTVSGSSYNSFDSVSDYYNAFTTNSWSCGISGGSNNVAGYQYTQNPYDNFGNYIGGGATNVFYKTVVSGMGTICGEYLQFSLPNALNMNAYSVISNNYYVNAPTRLSLGSITFTSMVLSYTASTTNGSNLNYYATTFPTTSTFTSTSTTMNLTGLTTGITYTVSLYATIRQGLQSSTVNISGTTVAYYVNAPTGLSLGSITSNSMVLSYNASSTNGTGLTYYATTSSPIRTFTSTSTTMDLTGLTIGTTYTISLYATISQGKVSSTTNISGTTAAYYVNAPTNLNYSGGVDGVFRYRNGGTNGTGLRYYATASSSTITRTFTSTNIEMIMNLSSGMWTISLYATINQGFQSPTVYITFATT